MRLQHFLVTALSVFIPVNAVSVPISHGNGRVYKVESSTLLSQLEHNSRNPNHSDNSYDYPLVELNNSTATTASILNQIIRGGNNVSLDDLGNVENPEVVAEELESAAKYLSHHATHGGDEDSDLTRALDGFVYFNGLYESLVRAGGKEAVLVHVKGKIHSWFSVNEDKNEMSVSVTVTQTWSDGRLGYRDRLKKPDRIRYVTLTNLIHETNIWVPDTYVLNEKRAYKHEVAPLWVTPDGVVTREQRMNVAVNCGLKTKAFPFDSPKCFVNLTSFSWNDKQLTYKWVSSSVLEPNLESNGFSIKKVRMFENTFSGGFSGNRSGLVMEFHLERSLYPYVIKYYVPLGCLCLVAIIGLMRGVGADIGIGLSYFIFGLMSIFVSLTFKDFNWGNSRNRLDLYYVLCVLTVLGTWIVNMFRLKSSTKPHASPESYEMHQDNQTDTCKSQNSRLWESDNMIDDEEYDNQPRNLCTESVKKFIRIAKSISWVVCVRINDFSLSLMVGLFGFWNFLYWSSCL